MLLRHPQVDARTLDRQRRHFLFYMAEWVMGHWHTDVAKCLLEAAARLGLDVNHQARFRGRSKLRGATCLQLSRLAHLCLPASLPNGCASCPSVQDSAGNTIAHALAEAVKDRKKGNRSSGLRYDASWQLWGAGVDFRSAMQVAS